MGGVKGNGLTGRQKTQVALSFSLQKGLLVFTRATEPMRGRILVCVSQLVKLRTSHPALGENDTEFLQVDLNEGKRVFTW